MDAADGVVGELGDSDTLVAAAEADPLEIEVEIFRIVLLVMDWQVGRIGWDDVQDELGLRVRRGARLFAVDQLASVRYTFQPAWTTRSLACWMSCST